MKNKILKIIYILVLTVLLCCSITNINYAASFDTHGLSIEIENATTTNKSSFNTVNTNDIIKENSDSSEENFVYMSNNEDNTEKDFQISDILSGIRTFIVYTIMLVDITCGFIFLVLAIVHIGIWLKLFNKNITEEEKLNIKATLKKSKKILLYLACLFIILFILDGIIQAIEVSHHQHQISPSNY